MPKGEGGGGSLMSVERNAQTPLLAYIKSGCK